MVINRKQVIISSCVLSALTLIYCLSFGPFVYALSYYGPLGTSSPWITPTYYVVFRPHLWVMYESESYYSYIIWFGKLGGGSRPTDWATYRAGYQRQFMYNR